MNTKFYGLFLALVGAVVFTGCSDDDDDIRVSDVPTAVMNTLQVKFPNVTRAEWENKQGYYVADFWQEGIETQVWIDQKAEWKMTELDFGTNLGLLPDAVQSAFLNGQYANWRVDDIDKYERTDRTFYLIEIETKGQQDRDLFFAQDGSLLKDEVDREKNEVTPTTTF